MGQKLVSPATYWRRRMVVLVAGIAVLALPAWAVNQALSGSRAAGQGPPGSAAGHVAGPGARLGARHDHGHALAGQAADLGPQPRVSPQLSPPPPGATTAPVPGLGRQACPGGALALTLRSAQHRYGPGQQVTFVVGVVSARSRPCRADLGSRFVSVVVTSAGAPIWDSSSCLRGTGSQVVTLRRGVPAFLQLSWDQKTSLSGCPHQGSAVRAGTYTVTAFDGQVRSQTTAFALGGRSAAAP